MTTATKKKVAKPLDWEARQKVSYCIPLWLRDMNIKLATERIKARIEPHYDRRSEPIAVVGFGPSLHDTWQQIRDFRFVITCSGSHKFLLDSGLSPANFDKWWHVEVDPREHKVTLLGPPHKDIEYLISSTCHPKVFDHLEGYNVKLWHVFDASEDGMRLLPPGEWAITGGCDAGLRAMTIAGFLGFRDLHVFGMDGSGRESSHAAAHPNAVKKYSPCEYGGVTYQTTPALLEAARQVWHELDQMPSVKATFYGEGLIQHMARDYKPKHAPAPAASLADIVGVNKPTLISAEYRELNARLHKENLAYGVSDGKHAPTVMKLVTTLAKTDGLPPSVLSYGCGKGLLAKALPFPIYEYDPAIPGKEESPRPADLCCCFDVLEHIEPEKLLYVLDDLRRVTKQVGYFVISTKPAQKQLADGRNTHLIVQGKKWWTAKLKKFFTVGKVIDTGYELHVVVSPKVNAKEKAA